MELGKYTAKAPGDVFELEMAELAEGTQKLYRRWFNNFLDFVGSTPDELLVFHEENRGAVRRAVLDYQRKLVEEEGLNKNTAKFVGKAVSKFLQSNDFTDFRMRDRSGTEYKGKLVLLPEQILSLYHEAGNSRRLRAIVMTLKESGLRPSDLVKMTVEDFHRARRIHTDNGEFIVWPELIETQKNKIYAHVHLGPESVAPLRDYIGDRTEGAIFLTERRMPRYEIQPDGSRRNTGEFTESGEPLTSINVSSCIKTLCKPLKAEGFDVSAISLRKFFFTYLSTKMELAYCKVLAGKKLPPVDAPYLQASQTGLLTELYIKHYDALRIFKPTDTDKEMQTLKQRMTAIETFTRERLDPETLYEMKEHAFLLGLETAGATQEQINQASTRYRKDNPPPQTN